MRFASSHAIAVLAGFSAWAASLPAAAQLSADEAAVLRGRAELAELQAQERADALLARAEASEAQLAGLLAENAAQAEALGALRTEAEAQRARLSALERQVAALLALQESDGLSAGAQAQVAQTQEDDPVVSVAPQPASPAAPPVQTAAAARPAPAAREPARSEPAPQETVGIAPEEEGLTTAVDLFAGLGGILTPKGTLYSETALRYAVSSDNRFFFSGLEIVDALIIGVIEARDTDRTTITASQGLRYGLTDRLEIEATVPFVYQEDRVANVAVNTPSNSIQDREGSGLGDVSVGLHYQLNEGRGAWPYLVANLRAKAPTGTGIFDADDDEAPTGSGYWSVEPSLTLIKRSDPVVLFGNIGYQANLGTGLGLTTTDEAQTGAVLADGTVILDGGVPPGADVFEPIVTTTLTQFDRFDPGDALRTSFGLGLALNEQVNVSFGYDQSYIFAGETDVVIRTVAAGAESGTVFTEDPPLRLTREGQNATIASYLFGISYRPTNRWQLNLGVNVGATEEAPDANVSLRSQMRF